MHKNSEKLPKKAISKVSFSLQPAQREKFQNLLVAKEVFQLSTKVAKSVTREKQQLLLKVRSNNFFSFILISFFNK